MTDVDAAITIPDVRAMNPVERVAFINDLRLQVVANKDVPEELLREAIRAIHLGIQENATTSGKRKQAKETIDGQALFDEL